MPVGHDGALALDLHAPELQTYPVGQAFPQAPQLLTSVAVLAHPEVHDVVPDGQLATHIPELQTFPAGQALKHAPQLFTSVPVFTHAVPHEVVPGGQVLVHTPEAQDCPVGHPRPHAPQLVVLVAMLASQPFARTPSQSAKPVSHEEYPQPVGMHAAVAWAGAQATPHPPQFAVDDAKLTSHPFDGMPSQSPYPGAQVPIVQPPIEHAAAALGNEQARPQLPQFVGLLWVFTSHPFATERSQSAQPGRHTLMAHDPLVQTSAATVGEVPARHATPQAPQLFRSLVRSTQPVGHDVVPEGQAHANNPLQAMPIGQSAPPMHWTQRPMALLHLGLPVIPTQLLSVRHGAGPPSTTVVPVSAGPASVTSATRTSTTSAADRTSTDGASVGIVVSAPITSVPMTSVPTTSVPTTSAPGMSADGVSLATASTPAASRGATSEGASAGASTPRASTTGTSAGRTGNGRSPTQPTKSTANTARSAVEPTKRTIALTAHPRCPRTRRQRSASHAG